MPESGYLFAHGLMNLHLQVGEERRTLPAVLCDGAVGREALAQAGPRARRVSRWDADGWSVLWQLLALLAEGRPVLAALPVGPTSTDLPTVLVGSYLIPPTVALRAAGTLQRGLALYLGAFAWEAAAFADGEMDEPRSLSGGLEPLYRQVIAEIYARERRVLLPQQVPDLLAEGYPFEVTDLLRNLLAQPIVVKELAQAGTGLLLGGEDGAILDALSSGLRQRGYAVERADPLQGLERLARLGGGLL